MEASTLLLPQDPHSRGIVRPCYLPASRPITQVVIVIIIPSVSLSSPSFSLLVMFSLDGGGVSRHLCCCVARRVVLSGGVAKRHLRTRIRRGETYDPVTLLRCRINRPVALGGCGGSRQNEEEENNQ